MLSCKNCGAQMSGVDLVCKKCGTPWGKKHKSRSRIYISIFAILLSVSTAYVYFTPNIDKTPFIELYNKYFHNNSNNLQNNPQPEVIASPTPFSSEAPTVNSPKPIETPISEPSPVPAIEPVMPKEPLPPVFPWISASSSLASQGKFSYGPDLTTDGSLSTAWLEGVKGDGIGEWLLYSAEDPQTVSSITIYNGYLKNNTTYINNGKIKKLSVEFSDGTIIPYDISKSNYETSKKGIKFILPETKETTSVKITILDVYKGAYYSDTAISGISFE